MNTPRAVIRLTRDELRILLNAPATGPAIVSLFDLRGRLVFERELSLRKGINQLPLSAIHTREQELPRGGHLLQVRMSKRTAIEN